MKIKKLPTTHPIKAPKIGINAVNATKIPIKSAYGIFNILNVTTNMEPRIMASRHCPARNSKCTLINLEACIFNQSSIRRDHISSFEQYHISNDQFPGWNLNSRSITQYLCLRTRKLL